ncbi:MAG: response regulator transcription factor [Bacteroidota bacterium]
MIDDHYLIIEGLYSSFDIESDEFTIVGSSLSIPEALEKISPEKVDIIILDLFIHQSNPIVNIESTTKAFPEIPIVILSHESSLYWQVEMFARGVRAYLLKEEDKSIMTQKLLQVSQGEIVMPKEVMEIINAGNVSLGSYIHTPEGREIISYLLQGHIPREIAKKVNQSESNIEKRLQKIRDFFNVRNNYELIIRLLNQQLS